MDLLNNSFGMGKDDPGVHLSVEVTRKRKRTMPASTLALVSKLRMLAVTPLMMPEKKSVRKTSLPLGNLMS